MEHNDPFSVGETDPLNDVVQIDPSKDYFAELVGEGKKYKDPFAAGQALAHKDAFIKKLLSETQGLREELKTRTNFETLMDRLEKQGKPNPGTPPEGSGNPPDKDETLTPDKIEQLLEQRLSQREQAAQKQQNYTTVVKAVQEKFGANAREVIAAKAEELGVGVDFLKQMAEERPKAFLAMLGEPKQTEPDLFSGPVRSQVNPAANKPLGSSVRNKAFYDKIRKTDPNKYWAADTQVQMHKDALALGEEFYR